VIVERARASNEQKLALALGVCALTFTSSRGAAALESSGSSELGELHATRGRGVELALGVHRDLALEALGFAALPRASGRFLALETAATERPNFLRLPALFTLGSPYGGTSGAWDKELAASTPYNDPKLGCAGPCTEAMPGLSLPSTWVASMAVLGFGAGMGLAMSSSKHERFGLPPLVRFKLAFRKAVATTNLRF